MNPKKNPKDKAKSAGISLEPDLIERGKDFAKKNGFRSLSNFARFLITQELKKSQGDKSYLLKQNDGTKAKCETAVTARHSSPTIYTKKTRGK